MTPPPHSQLPTPNGTTDPVVFSGLSRLLGVLLVLGSATTTPYLWSTVSPPATRITEIPHVHTFQQATSPVEAPASAVPPGIQTRTPV
jgi:hypothetical protein